MVPQISWITKGTFCLLSIISSSAWAFWFCYNGHAHITETQTLKGTFHATASPQRRFRGGFLVYKLWNSWKLKPLLCDASWTEKSCALDFFFPLSERCGLPRSAASVGQTLAGFLSNVRADDYVSDLCVFPRWGAHLRIAHATAGSLSLQTQPCRGMLVSSSSSSELPFALSLLPHATVVTDTFCRLQLCSNNTAAF